MNINPNIINNIVQGDNLKLLKEIPNNSVNLVITSPPYFQQRDYGGGIGNERTPEEYIKNLLECFKECIRVIREDGSVVFNIGDKYKNSNLLLIPYRFAIEAQNLDEVRLVNNITWIKTNPTPRQFQKRLVQSSEPFFHFVKSDKYYYNIKSFMKNGSNNKKSNGNNVGKKYFDLIESSSLSNAEKELAVKELSEVINEVKEGTITGFRMKIRGLHSLPFGGQEGGRKTQIIKKGFTIIKIYGRKLKRDIIESAVETLKGTKHPAIYPEYIIKEFIKLLTKKEGIVLDPFMGSGTTAVASLRLNRRYIGFELNPTYVKNAKERVENLKYQLSLDGFNEDSN